MASLLFAALAAEPQAIGRVPERVAMNRFAAGLILGAVATLAVERGLRYSTSHQHRESDEIFKWAYQHVPGAVESPPGSARMLDVKVEPVASTPSERARREVMFNVRLVYETDRQIKVIKTICRFDDGKMISPSDPDLRALDAGAAPFPVPR